MTTQHRGIKMEKKRLYISGSTVSPKKIGKVCGYRLIADEGMELWDGETATPCIDIADEDLEKWSERPAAETGDIQ